jgi:hypothetical protein
MPMAAGNLHPPGKHTIPGDENQGSGKGITAWVEEDWDDDDD